MRQQRNRLRQQRRERARQARLDAAREARKKKKRGGKRAPPKSKHAPDGTAALLGGLSDEDDDDEDEDDYDEPLHRYGHYRVLTLAAIFALRALLNLSACPQYRKDVGSRAIVMLVFSM
jgi:hypothetical protein